VATNQSPFLSTNRFGDEELNAQLVDGATTTVSGDGTASSPYSVEVNADRLKSDVCYQFTDSTITRYDSLQYAWVQGQFNNGQFLNVINSSPPGVVGTFAPITVHNGTNWVAPATLQAELVSKVLPLFQTQWPQLNSVEVRIDGSNTLFVDFYNSADPTVDYSSNSLAIGGTGSQAFIFGPAFVDIGSTGAPFIVREVVLNGQTAYYEDDALVTNPTRIAQLQALIAAAGTSAVVVCVSGYDSPVLLHAKYASKTFNSTPTEVTNYHSILAQSVPGAFNLTTGRFTVPVAGWYRISALLLASANWSANQYVQLNFLKNGALFDISQTRSTGGNVTVPLCGEAFVQCVIGDTLSIALESGQSATTASDPRVNELFIMQVK
jgi:hypothetical protein